MWRIPINPERYAQDLLHQLKIDIIPTPVEEICSALKINLISTDEIDAEAIMMKKGSVTNIYLKSGSMYEKRQRFTIAHELGHHSIPHHMGEIYCCSFSDIFSYCSNKEAETEANKFAAELLMPMKTFDKELKQKEFSMATLIQLSGRYETSLIATAIRFISNCEDPGSIIL